MADGRRAMGDAHGPVGFSTRDSVASSSVRDIRRRRPDTCWSEDVRRAVRSPETPARELEEGTCGARSRITASPRRDVGSVFAITPPGTQGPVRRRTQGVRCGVSSSRKDGNRHLPTVSSAGTRHEKLDTRGIESRIRLCRSRGFLGKTNQGRKGEIEEEEERTG